MAEKKLIHLVQRHGQTTLNSNNSFRSRLDPPLNEKGLAQAEAAAEYFKSEGTKIERIVSTPLLRGVQTADVFSEVFDIPVEQDRALISWNLGFMGGKDKDVYEEILEYYIDHPKSVVPDGESLDDLEQRIFDYFDKELKKEDKLTLFVTHNSNIVAINKMIDEEFEGRPEGDSAVAPGGTLGIYVDASGKYSVETLFGKEEEVAFGS